MFSRNSKSLWEWLMEGFLTSYGVTAQSLLMIGSIIQINKIPLGHNRSNVAIYSKINFKLETNTDCKHEIKKFCKVLIVSNFKFVSSHLLLRRAKKRTKFAYPHHG